MIENLKYMPQIYEKFKHDDAAELTVLTVLKIFEMHGMKNNEFASLTDIKDSSITLL